MEPGWLASEARMAKRRRHAVSEGLEGRSERPGDMAWIAPWPRKADPTQICDAGDTGSRIHPIRRVARDAP